MDFFNNGHLQALIQGKYMSFTAAGLTGRHVFTRHHDPIWGAAAGVRHPVAVGRPISGCEMCVLLVANTSTRDTPAESPFNPSVPPLLGSSAVSVFNPRT